MKLNLLYVAGICTAIAVLWLGCGRHVTPVRAVTLPVPEAPAVAAPAPVIPPIKVDWASREADRLAAKPDPPAKEKQGSREMATSMAPATPPTVINEQGRSSERRNANSRFTGDVDRRSGQSRQSSVKTPDGLTITYGSPDDFGWKRNADGSLARYSKSGGEAEAAREAARRRMRDLGR